MRRRFRLGRRDEDIGEGTDVSEGDLARPRAAAPRGFPDAAPLLITIACIGLIALVGRTQRDLFGTPLEPFAYGFFLDRYPLFAFAIVYGVARIGRAAFEPGPRRWPRTIGAPLGLALLLAACLYPTFGGLVVRPGYMAGSIAFMRNTPLPAAFAIGALVSAVVYGLALGIGSALARWRLTLVGRQLVRALLSFATLWWAALVLGAPRALGWDLTAGWPATPLSAVAALQAGAVVALALTPHAVLTRRIQAAEAPSLPMAKLPSPA